MKILMTRVIMSLKLVATYDQYDQVSDSTENYPQETIVISSTDEGSIFKDGQQFVHVNKLFCASL